MRFQEFINEGWIETSKTEYLKKYLQDVKGIRQKTKLAIEAELRKRQGQSQNINTSDKLKPSVDVNKHIIPGIIKSYLNKDTVEKKYLEFNDNGENYSGSVWVGKINKTDKWALAFYSYDLGIEAKLKTYLDEVSAKNAYNQIKNNIEYDDILKFFK